jgi:methyl-accepting chemotaxis protein
MAAALRRVLSNLPLYQKLIIPAAILVAILGIVIWQAYAGLAELVASNHRMVDEDLVHLMTAEDLLIALGQAGLAEQAIIIETEDDKAAALFADYQRSAKRAQDLLNSLMERGLSSEAQDRWLAVQKLFAAYDAASRKSIKHGLRHETDAAWQFSTVEAAPARETLAVALKEQVDAAAQRIRTAKAASEALEASVKRRMIGATILGLAIALAVAGAIILIEVVRPLHRLTGQMTALAGGELEIAIAGADRRDEIGTLAQALHVFQGNSRAMRRLEEDRAAAKSKADSERRAATLQLADTFERTVGGIVGIVAAAAASIKEAAQSLSGVAEDSSQQATMVSAAVSQASVNVQAVATATQGLAQSIEEIAQRLGRSKDIAGRAVSEAGKADVTIEALALAAQRIGKIVTLIQNIAGQTNLLALNATIEAARADNAGKGFAVVASEVKALADQTAHATDDIKAQIQGIQATTGEAVAAIRTIGESIDQIDRISAEVAAAVTQQSVATSGIAGNIEQVARGMDDASANMAGVTDSSAKVGAAAAQVLAAAGELSTQSQRLTVEVQNFLATVRGA